MPLSILIVDDSPSARMMLRSFLTSELHEIHEASNGREAVERFRAIGPDLVFMDITMPEMNGLDALEAIRAEFPDASVAMLTADVQKQTIERANRAGALAFVKKPPTRERVEEVVKALRAGR